MADYFYNAIRRDITMIQNDTLSFAFQVQGLKGQTPNNIVFTCKETIETSDALFSVDLSNNITLRDYDEDQDIYTYVVRIPPALTEKIALGRYFYDLQLSVNYDIFTLMKGRLTIEYQITGGSVEPEPEYENGDLVKYPLTEIPLGTIKLYTEQYISDIASWINTILVDPNGEYTTEEMSGALSDINDYLLALSASLKTALSDTSTDEISLPDMPAAMNTINSDLSDISDAINSITGGSSDVPISQMANSINIIGDSVIPCLCSTNAQSILLPVYGNDDLVFKFKLLKPNTEYNTAVVAGGWGSWKFLFQTNENNTYLYYTGARSSVTIPAKIWEWQDVELGSGYAIVDGVTYTGGSRTRDADQISMFGVPSYYSSVAISETEIYKDGNLIMRLVPKEDNDGHGYFHDEINNIDYYSTTDTHLIYQEIKV